MRVVNRSGHFSPFDCDLSLPQGRQPPLCQIPRLGEETPRKLWQRFSILIASVRPCSFVAWCVFWQQKANVFIFNRQAMSWESWHWRRSAELWQDDCEFGCGHSGVLMAVARDSV